MIYIPARARRGRAYACLYINVFVWGFIRTYGSSTRARPRLDTCLECVCAFCVCLCVRTLLATARDGIKEASTAAHGADRRRARRCFFLFFFVAHSSRLAPSRDARRRCGDDIPFGISVVVPRACARRFRIVIRRLASRATALARAPRVRLRVRKPLSFVGSCLRSRRDARGDCDREGARERVDG